MTFYGKSFIFDGIPSENYGLYVVNFKSGEIDSPGGSGIEIYKTEIYRRPVPFMYGVSQRPVLEFPITIGSPEYLSGADRSIIQSWLFGQSEYKKLQIVQCDLDTSYFNCLLTNPTIKYVGNLAIAWECTVVCDRPWAIEYPKTSSLPISGNYNYFNKSANADYTYPSLTFTLSSIGDFFQIVNLDDVNRTFLFDDLTASESITVDNDRKIITSSLGLYRIDKFNLNWLRLKKGLNRLVITGQITSATMTVQNAVKVGG